jgi:hypothetical protein
MAQYLNPAAEIFLPPSAYTVERDHLKKWSIELKDLIYKYCKLYEYDYPIEEQDKVSDGLDEYEKIIRQKFMEVNYELFHNHYSKNKRLLHLHCFLHNYFINGPDIELSKDDIEIYRLSIDSFVKKINE